MYTHYCVHWITEKSQADWLNSDIDHSLVIGLRACRIGIDREEKGMSTPRIIATLLICAAGLSGCATEGMSIPIGEASNFPPTVPEQISMLLAPPSKPHRVIALVDGVASTDDYLSVARTQAAALDAMKKEAARLGANAIVLTGKGSTPYAQVTTTTGTANASAVAVGDGVLGSGFFNSTSTTMGFQKIQVSGTAIRYTE